MKYYLYIILTVDNTLYCGITPNVFSRYEAHINGVGAKYTRAHKPKSIVYLCEYDDKKLAAKEEYRIKKTLSRLQKLELIENNKNTTKMLIDKLKKQ